MMKKLIALLMILCLSVSMLAGCGSKDEDDKEDAKSKVVKGDMFDMLEAMGNTKSGVVKADFDMKYDGQFIKGTITCGMDAASKACSFGISFDMDASGRKFNLSIDDLFVVADKNLYLNLKNIMAAVLKLAAMSGEESVKQVSDAIDLNKLGWFKIPLPDDLPDYNDKLQKSYVNSFVSLFENMLKNTKLEGEDGDYTAVLKTKDDLAQVVVPVRDFLKSDLKGLVNNTKSSLTDFNIDLDKYFDKLVSTYKQDILDVGKDYGLDEASLDQMIKSVKDMKLNEQFAKYKGEIEKELSTDALTDEQINEMTKPFDEVIEKLKSYDKEIPMESSIRVKADDSSYTADVKLNAQGSDNKKVDVNLSVNVKPGDPGIKAPGSVMSVKEIADLVTPLMSTNGGRLITP